MAKESKGSKDAKEPPAEEPTRAKTPRERQEEQRQAKLDAVQEQVESGSLVIRKMTAAERKKFPPKPRQEKPKRR